VVQWRNWDKSSSWNGDQSYILICTIIMYTTVNMVFNFFCFTIYQYLAFDLINISYVFFGLLSCVDFCKYVFPLTIVCSNMNHIFCQIYSWKFWWITFKIMINHVWWVINELWTFILFINHSVNVMNHIFKLN
jgi:hypothetical protein